MCGSGSPIFSQPLRPPSQSNKTLPPRKPPSPLTQLPIIQFDRAGISVYHLPSPKLVEDVNQMSEEAIIPPLPEPSTEVTLSFEQRTDLTDEEIILHLFGGRIAESYRSISKEIWDMDEDERIKVAYYDTALQKGRPLGKRAEHTDGRLRVSFWKHVDELIQKRSEASQSRLNVGFIKPNIKTITRGICGYHNFLNHTIHQSMRMSIIFTRPNDDYCQQVAQYNMGSNRLYEILALPITTRICRCHYQCVCKPPPKTSDNPNPEKACACKAGCICPEKSEPKNGELILKTLEMLQLRIKGSIPQVINQRTLAMHRHEHSKAADAPKELTKDELYDKVMALRKKQDTPALGAGEVQAPLAVIEKSVEAIPEAEVVEIKDLPE